MAIKAINVFYEHSHHGLNTIKVACELKRKLALDVLHVFVETMPGDNMQETNSLVLRRVRDHVEAFLPACELEVKPKSSFGQPGLDELLVANHYQDDFHGLNALITFEEESFLAKGNPRIVLPFGSAESGLYAAQFTLPLAAALGFSIDFYHTTWSREGVDAGKPELHMCEAAQFVQKELEAHASKLGVVYDTTVECADDVVEGLIQFSLRKESSMIAMAHGKNTGWSGSYVTQALHQSPVPVLISGRKEVLP